MVEREATIGIALRDGAIIVKTKIKVLSQADLALLISHLDILREELLNIFKKGVKKINE